MVVEELVSLVISYQLNILLPTMNYWLVISSNIKLPTINQNL
jgi:hypothetical protein